MFKSLLKTIDFYRNIESLKLDLIGQTKRQITYGKNLGGDIASIALWSAIAFAFAFFALPTLLILIYTVLYPHLGPVWTLVVILGTLLSGAIGGGLVAKSKISAIKKPPSLHVPRLDGTSGAKLSLNALLPEPLQSWLVLAAEEPHQRKMAQQSEALIRDLKPRAEALADAIVLEIVDGLHNGNRRTKAAILSSLVASWFSSKIVTQNAPLRKNSKKARQHPTDKNQDL